MFPFNTKNPFQKWSKADTLPKNDFLKCAVLEELLQEFECCTYTEEELRKIISCYFSDIPLIRRELINFGYIQREPHKAIYFIVKRHITEEDINNNTRLKKHAESFKKTNE